MFECDDCKRCFDEEWKLSGHLKSHKKYACNKCDKTFKWQDVMEKHVRISHENVKLFCHYFNNGLECPYNDECIFVHEDSEVCKYGAMCERNNCMYKHEEENDDEENGDEENGDEENGNEVNGDGKDNNGLKTNMFGVQFVMWFDVSIEGKDSMNPDEDDWGGRIEFGYSKKGFSVELQDYFIMFEDECSTLTHNCAGRIRGVLFNMKDKALKPPDFDSRSIIDLIEKYEDAHILDCGWREVDPEEWFE